MAKVGTVFIIVGIIELIYLVSQGSTFQDLIPQALTPTNICTGTEPSLAANVLGDLGNASVNYTVGTVTSCSATITALNLSIFDVSVDKLHGTQYARSIYNKEITTANASNTAPGTAGGSCIPGTDLNKTYTCANRASTVLDWYKCDSPYNKGTCSITTTKVCNNETNCPTGEICSVTGLQHNWTVAFTNATGVCPIDKTYYWCNYNNTLVVTSNETGLVNSYFDKYYICTLENRCSADTDCTSSEYCAINTTKLCAPLVCSDKQIIQNHACVTVECTSTTQCIKNVDSDCDGDLDAFQGSCTLNNTNSTLNNLCVYTAQQDCPSIGKEIDSKLIYLAIGFILGGFLLNKKNKKST